MKEQIMKKINQIFEILNSESSINKKELHPFLLELNDMLELEMKDYNSNYDRGVNLFRYNEDERLEQIESKIKLFQTKPEIALFEGIKYCENKLNEFLDNYHIGFKQTFELNNGGLFKVEIPALIRKNDCFGEKKISEEIHFELQMENLKKIGIETNCDKNKNVKILATEKSIKNLRKLLIDFGARTIDFNIWEYKNSMTLNLIKFYIKPSNLLKNNYNIAKVELSSDKNFINLDEESFIIHELKELWSAYLYFKQMKEVKDSCYYIIRSCFYQVCKTVECENSITKEEENKHKKNREKNLLIREKENQLGSLISGELIENTAKKIYEKLNKIGYEHCNFRCHNLSISSHSLNAEFYFSTDFCFEDNIARMEESTIKSILECIGNLKDESLKVLATEKNMETLNKIIKENIPSAMIVNFNIENHWSINSNFIKSFTISIDNLNSLF